MQITVDKEYLNRTIDHLEKEKQEHDKKFAGNAHHKNCLPRFDAAIAKLKDELSKVNQAKQQ